MQIVFFNRPKYKQFDYKCRYYDEKKERQEQRRKVIEEGGTGGGSKNLKRDIERRWHISDRKNRNKSKGANLLVYLFIVALLVYFVFFV